MWSEHIEWRSRRMSLHVLFLRSEGNTRCGYVFWNDHVLPVWVNGKRFRPMHNMNAGLPANSRLLLSIRQIFLASSRHIFSMNMAIAPRYIVPIVLIHLEMEFEAYRLRAWGPLGFQCNTGDGIFASKIEYTHFRPAICHNHHKGGLKSLKWDHLKIVTSTGALFRASE